MQNLFSSYLKSPSIYKKDKLVNIQLTQISTLRNLKDLRKIITLNYGNCQTVIQFKFNCSFNNHDTCCKKYYDNIETILHLSSSSL